MAGAAERFDFFLDGEAVNYEARSTRLERLNRVWPTSDSVVACFFKSCKGCDMTSAAVKASFLFFFFAHIFSATAWKT
ncbi:hypothetical protein GGTG_08552 [Gaeumannomyces tritici R3-111a-1]|uniref:Uncharacterized protein n=1 Tax=Gaeumannomyces tritici (strain R3-111a-1) TaxID=644352 RepID=J3P4W6_GAET3|nr:hypothetical protein GGTG_08552 [Gaeumannomyces tritici R3-111a-1]EJT74714.1 hypothetical protein GGTG_08552 [Gaeumannomyces tritici R3-111a-1]